MAPDGAEADPSIGEQQKFSEAHDNNLGSSNLMQEDEKIAEIVYTTIKLH